jgi:hypothetical protein
MDNLEFIYKEALSCKKCLSLTNYIIFRRYGYSRSCLLVCKKISPEKELQLYLFFNQLKLLRAEQLEQESHLTQLIKIKPLRMQ